MNLQAALVKSILERWEAFDWTVQGFGFLRTKIQGVGRIHVWDSRLRTPLVSDLHSHPWPFRSTIISGELINQRFVDSESGGLPYVRSRIATGEGGGLIGEPEEVSISDIFLDLYGPGDVYAQVQNDLHRTLAQDGTVTLIERPQGPPLEEALVYWPRGTEWVSAEPRRIEKWQMEPTIRLALARWSA